MGCGDRDAGLFLDRHAGAINPRMIAGAGELFGPNTEICVVAGGQTAAFFDIEKDDGSGSKPFGLGSIHGVLCILDSDSFCRASLLSSRLSRPRYKTRKPKPRERRNSRLPRHVFVLSPGGGLSQ